MVYQRAHEAIVDGRQGYEVAAVYTALVSPTQFSAYEAWMSSTLSSY